MENKNNDIPDIIVARLPRYLRALNVLREKGNTTNSQELGNFLGFSAAQIRKDLSQFGEFGKQGTGYNIDFLSNQQQSYSQDSKRSHPQSRKLFSNLQPL